MPWYAVEALDDAIETTKALLLPVEVRSWLKLAIVVFFLGSASVSPPSGGGPQYTVGANEPVPGDLPIPTDTVFAIVLAIVAIGLLVVLLFAIVGSVMEFAFVESLRTREVHVRRYMSDHLGQGFRLFGFRFVLFLPILLSIVGLVLAFVPAAIGDVPSVTIGLLVFIVPAIILLGIFVALIDGLTRNFVVPVMILRGGGVLAGWRAFWPTLRDQWKQYGVYVLLRFVLTIAAGLVVSLVGGVVAIVLLLPFVVLGGLLFVGFGGPAALMASPSLVAVASFGILALAYGLLFLFALAVVRVPVQAYLGYYALLVLGDSNREFDLIPDLREEIR
ncbi:DUF7544 domain-containing protein [Haladaptatus sp. NG-SE-30]